MKPRTREGSNRAVVRGFDYGEAAQETDAEGWMTRKNPVVTVYGNSGQDWTEGQKLRTSEVFGDE